MGRGTSWGDAGELTHTSVGAELVQRGAESSEAILNMRSLSPIIIIVTGVPATVGPDVVLSFHPTYVFDIKGGKGFFLLFFFLPHTYNTNVEEEY